MVLTIVSGLLWGEPVSYGQASAESAKGPVAAVEVRGNVRIEAATIRSRIKTREGEPFSPATIREDIKALYQLGFFSDVRVESEPADGGVKVIYIVTERPFVVDVDFVGNQAILTDKLKEKITIKKQAFLDDVQVKANSEALKRAYDEEGYYNTTVIPVLKTQDDKVTLLYYIKEGAKAVINRVDFEGRRAYDPGILQKQIETHAYSRFSSWLTSSGYYKKSVLDEDIERLKDYYQNNGYLQVQVGSPLVEFKDDRSFANVPYPILRGELDYVYEFYNVRARVTFPLVEGDQYRIQSIAFEGQHVFDTDELRKALKLQEGDLFRRNALREGIGTIHDLYGEKGHLYASVVPQYDADPETKTVRLTVSITEDNPIRVRQILISGNEKTRDKVIRREVRVREQEMVNTQLLRRSFQRINNLNFFDSIDIAPERVGADEADLQVRVKEKSTGALSAGGGYSSVDRLMGMFEVTQGNLFGRGQLLRARAEFGQIRSSYSLTFREPYLLDYPVSGTVSLYNQSRDYKTYKSRNIGGDLILGKSFTEYVSGSLNLSSQSTRISDLSSDLTQVPDQIETQRGTTEINSISATIAYDTRDFYFDPREGTRVALTQELAGLALGGDADFTKTIVDVSRFFPLFWDTVFSLHGRFGFIHAMQRSEIPLGERFYVGGMNSVRGFEYGEAGPVDPITGEILGGNKELVFNGEFLFPIVSEAKVKGVIFYDLGKGFDDHEPVRLDELRDAAGFGIRWISPMGPLRLEWGYNLHPELTEEKVKVEFTIGTLF